MYGCHNRDHSVWKSQKKSHSTLRAKRDTFTFCVDKIWLKMPKMVNFGEFLKTWSLLPKSVTRQVTFKRTKMVANAKNQNGQNSQNWRFLAFLWTFGHSKCKRISLRSQCWMRLFLWFSNTVHNQYIFKVQRCRKGHLIFCFWQTLQNFFLECTSSFLRRKMRKGCFLKVW